MDVEKVIEKIKDLPTYQFSHQNLLLNNLGNSAIPLWGVGATDVINIIKSHQADKVVWPKYVAENWEHRLHAEDGNFGFALESTLDGEYTSDETNTWLFNDGNLKTFLEGVLHGYTVEKKKKYKLVHPDIKDPEGKALFLAGNGQGQYGLTSNDIYTHVFSEQELLLLPNWTNQLDREEVEDDE